MTISAESVELERQLASALDDADRRHRILAQHTSDVVLDCAVDGTIVWASPSVQKTLGVGPEEWLGRTPHDLIAAADHHLMLTVLAPDTSSGSSERSVEVRFIDAWGDARWMSVRSQRYSHGDHLDGVVLELRDVHDAVLLRRAATTLSAANAILVRAVEEHELLTDMCEVAVADAGYVFCWYGRAVDDEEQSVRAVASSVTHSEYLLDITVSWGDGPLGRGPTGTCLRTGALSIVDDFLRADHYRPWRSQAVREGFRSSLSLPVFVDGTLDGAFMVYAAEAMAFDAAAVALMTDLATQVGIGIARIRDTRSLAKAAEDRRLLGTAIDQAAEAIIVTDQDAVIRYANPAALRISGYALHDVLGHNPSIFQSGLHDDRFYEDMWRRLLGGQSWHGVLINRRRDGEIYEEEATIAPVHDDAGRRVAYVAVKHDLSRERELQEVVQRDQSDRDAIVEVMRDVRAGDSLETTAASLCAAVRRFEHIDGCMVALLTPDGAALPVAIAGASVPEMQSVGRPLDNDKLALMVEICRAGPWWMDLRDPDGVAATDARFRDAMLQHGFTATAYAPIRWEGETIGVVSVVTSAADAETWMPVRLGVLAEIGSFAGMLLGPQAIQHARRDATRGEIADIIARQAFRIVFEPVVHLPSGAVIGYEALTRFTDGVAPDRRFEAAQAVGLGSELEAACARRAVIDAATLPEHVWLSVNFSPATLVDGTAADVVRGASRQIVIEITEHNAIENYSAVRRAIAECGDILVAVDDAGSGFASLRHILELEPDIIKLDIALVRDIDTDPARQALAAGMRHFAALTGTTLIAEGVETDAEARSIRQLGVELAQGFLFAHDGGRRGETTP
jgi:PAS domain S-box-containing protein